MVQKMVATATATQTVSYCNPLNYFTKNDKVLIKNMNCILPGNFQ